MCLVTGDPRIRAAEHGELIRAIWGTLAQQIASSGDYGVVMDQTFAPVRVICEPDGRLTAVFPYPADGD